MIRVGRSGSSVVVGVALLGATCGVGCGGSAVRSEGPAEEERRSEGAAGGEHAASDTPATASDGQAATDETASAAQPALRTAPIVPPHGPLSEEDLHRGILARLRDPRFPSCTVSALPPAYRRRVTAEVDADALRREVSMPLPDSAVTAARAPGDREIAIYLSSALDPRSELGDLGYRVRVRAPGGAEEDLALGLTALRPLVLAHNPMIPLLDRGEEGDVVQVEAELRALDDQSVDFEPAEGTTGGVRTVRDGRERLVRCRLEDLRRDQDGDGLTDLAEERLLTDAWDPDTDGDGTRDGDDRSPLGAAPASARGDEVWVATVRALMREAQGGLEVVARSGARLDVPDAGEREGVVGRVLVLREDELGAYQRRFGLRAPTVIAVTPRGDARAEVVVDSVWRQRSFEARRDASGAWTLAPRERAAASRR